jgi:hypothetical protein
LVAANVSIYALFDLYISIVIPISPQILKSAMIAASIWSNWSRR